MSERQWRGYLYYSMVGSSWLWGGPLWNPLMSLGPDLEKDSWCGWDPRGCRGTSLLLRRVEDPSLFVLASLRLDPEISCLLPIALAILFTQLDTKCTSLDSE